MKKPDRQSFAKDAMFKQHQKNKKQHYVPRFYLKNFCERNRTINVFDKKQLKTFKNNINDIACGNYFYDFDIEESEDRQVAERMLSEFENSFSPAFDSILSKLNSITEKQIIKNGGSVSLQLSKYEQESLSFFFIIQIFRTKAYRKKIAEMFKFLLENMLEIEFKEKALDVQVHEDKLAYHQTKGLFENLPKLALYLMQQKWFFGVNLSSRPFYTSDNPAILDSRFCNDDVRGKGICSERMCFHLPLSSEYLLSIVEKSSFDNTQTVAPIDNMVMIYNDDNVLDANDLQLNKCLSQVYASSSKYFDEDRAFILKKPLAQ